MYSGSRYLEPVSSTNGVANSTAFWITLGCLLFVAYVIFRVWHQLKKDKDKN